ncbi:MAG: LGFP repeat-containing protein [Oryzihumus sp.]
MSPQTAPQGTGTPAGTQTATTPGAAQTALAQATTASSPAARLVERASRALGRFSRRGFLVRTAVAGSALVAHPKDYVLKAQDAYATICGPGNTYSAGWTVFCCTVNNGVNACPPGTFSAGWWKAADSSWCCGGYRYIVDCNATCSSCSSGCSGDHFCDSACWSCKCGKGPSSSCDQRRHCCNAFRYGQCNTQVKCSGGVACRVVSCVPPYKWAQCSTTTLVDNRTSEHSAPCLQGCGPILTRYNALGANGSYLGGSTGPERAVGDNKGRYVTYQHGSIYWTKATGARAIYGLARDTWSRVGGPRGALGYPTGERVAHSDGSFTQSFEHGLVADTSRTTASVVYGWAYTVWAQHGREGGVLGYPNGDRVTRSDGTWTQLFEHGLLCDTPHTVTSVVYGWAYTVWAQHRRENGVLGFPNGDRVTQQDGSWAQQFEHGVMCDSPHTSTAVVTGDALTKWVALGREKGELGYPQADRTTRTDGSWIQLFDGGAVCDSPATGPAVVRQPVYTAWVQHGRETGALGYPGADRVSGADSRGVGQAFTGGEVWALSGGAAYVVTGRVLARWKADGAETGTWGYPVGDVSTDADGTEHGAFEHGTITVPPAG